MTASCDLPPIPVPGSVRRVLVFGGTFDPPHRAHLELPPLARDRMGMDWVVYVPAARSPHKAQSPGATGADRVRMLELGLEGVERVSVWPVEIHAGEGEGRAVYTVESIREALRQRPDLEPRLLIGADQAAAFHLWREPSAIMRLAPPAVMLRPDTPGGEGELVNRLARIWGAESAGRWASWIVHVPVIDASATRVRSLLGAWRDRATAAPDPVLASMVPPAVLAYIRDRGLYAPAG